MSLCFQISDLWPVSGTEVNSPSTGIEVNSGQEVNSAMWPFLNEAKMNATDTERKP